MEPKVSIILPSLNVVDYISECIESIIGQTLKEIEIICIDAGSVDGTYEVLQKYAQQDNRIILLHSPEKSYGKQVNMGMQIARGKYIAIVETDDFVEKEMYKTLYYLAESNDVDYAKADYDSFITLKSGKRIYTQRRLFSKKDELYGTVFAPSDELSIFQHDTAIWKGIYNRSFLQNNFIEFNETSGAAFQDIGFMLQVLCKAQKVIYAKHSFYRYRMDREESSSNNLHGLRYAYQEFKRLYSIGLLEHNTEDKCLQGIYQRMGGVFLSEIEKILKRFDGSADVGGKKEAVNYYEWFCSKLQKALAQGILRKTDYPEQEWFKLKMLLHSLPGYADYLFVQDQISKEAEKEFLLGFENKKVIIFGSGLRGRHLYEKLYRKDFEVAAFCDNNKEIWGNAIGDIQVKSLLECMNEYKDAVYVIACRNYANEISMQLLDYGIERANIQIFGQV